MVYAHYTVAGGMVVFPRYQRGLSPLVWYRIRYKEAGAEACDMRGQAPSHGNQAQEMGMFQTAG